MKFLVDNSLSPLLAALLTECGHDAIHVRDIRLEAAPDSFVLNAALIERRVLISADSDFSRLLILGGLRQPSLIHLREGKPYEPAIQLDLIQEHIAAIEQALELGSIVVFRHGRFRSRRLGTDEE